MLFHLGNGSSFAAYLKQGFAESKTTSYPKSANVVKLNSMLLQQQ